MTPTVAHSQDPVVLTATDLSWSDLSGLHDQAMISHMDYYMAESLGRNYPDASALALLSCVLASDALSRGHVSLDLGQMAGQSVELTAGTTRITTRIIIRLPDLDTWLSALASSGFTGKEADHDPKEGMNWVYRFPLILDRDNHLYLSKYFDFQERVIRNITARISETGTGPDQDFIRTALDRSFAGQDPGRTAGQRMAVALALTQNFLVISGGPGTGKTHVTGMILSLMQEWATATGRPRLRIMTMAPTGKAAARLREGATIHSALKPKSFGKGFLHDADHPLPADLVIVDEASMIDMALMARLLEAVPMGAKLILLGDGNQLSPVQAGAVFTDLCQLPQMAAYRVSLNFNFRSMGKSGIEKLARAVNDQDIGELKAVLSSGEYPDIGFVDSGNKPMPQGILEKYLLEGYRELARARSQDQALDRLDRFRVLCAHIRGDTGTLQVNHLCEKLLQASGSDGITKPLFKQIVMVARNDYARGLFNGDTGVVLREDKGPVVCFRDADNQVRSFAPAQMPDHEPAFAMTIHKAQGSEFDRVLILIPDRVSPVMTRQLLYTGITRARSKAVIAGSLEVICQAVTAPLERRSNLAGRLKALLDTTHNHTTAEKKH